MLPPWKKYKIGPKSSRSNFVNPSCQEFDVVYHVAHLETAERILKDNSCRAGLIFDESKLRKERLLVNWLSPNTWAYGSRYGNVGFVMDFAKLIKDKRYYWVESITYKPDAVRILITDIDHDHHLEVYDPTMGDGPWFFDEEGNTHYRNGDYTLELMLEDDIPLRSFTGVQFFTHHARFCNIDPTSCRELDLQGARAGERFIAGILANDLPIQVKHFREEKRGKQIPNHQLIHAIHGIKARTYRTARTLFEEGYIKDNDPIGPLIMKAALQHLRDENNEEFKMLAGMFFDSEHFENVLIALTKEKFKLSAVEKLIDS